MATDPNTNDKNHKREKDRQKKRKALDEATKQDHTKNQGYWQKLKKTFNEKTGHKSRIRVLPIWLRIIIVLALKYRGFVYWVNGRIRSDRRRKTYGCSQLGHLAAHLGYCYKNGIA